jgi:hypothetical protein
VASRGHLVLIHSDQDNLITELSRIAADLNSIWTPAQTLKKYHALLAQLNLMMHDQDLDPFEKFEVLTDFFFHKKQFSPLLSKPTTIKFLLPYALLSRSGPSELLLLLFICLCQSLQLPIQVIKNDEKIVIKVVYEGKSFLFDFRRRCEALTTDEILKLINEGCDCTKSLTIDEVLSRYLLTIKTQSLRERSFINLYKIQTYLIYHQPFVLNHIVDRARAAYAIGDVVKAAEDIGQYLAFHSEKISNNKFLKLIGKLNRENIMKNLPPFRDHE